MVVWILKLVKGSMKINQKSPKLSLVKPKISKNECESTFDFDKAEYKVRVQALNRIVKDFINKELLK